MLELIDSNKALDALKRYFYLLTKTGYVKSATVRKYLVYLFAIDFAHYAMPFLDEGEYIMLDRLMKQTFTNGGCLLPYPVACAKRVTLGDNGYMGKLKIRRTEDINTERPGIEKKDRSTQDEHLRTV